MATLNIDLQEGFTKDEIRIEVNGREVYHNSCATTQLLVGLADSARVPVPDGPTTIKIAVPSRGLSRTEAIQATGDTYLGISIDGRGLQTHTSGTPFGYA